MLTQVPQQTGDNAQRRSKPRLVLLQRGQERIRIPRRTCGLRRNVGDVSGGELPRESEDVLSRSTAAVQQDRDDPGVPWGRSEVKYRVVGVRILYATHRSWLLSR